MTFQRHNHRYRLQKHLFTVDGFAIEWCQDVYPSSDLVGIGYLYQNRMNAGRKREAWRETMLEHMRAYRRNYLARNSKTE